MRFIKLASLFPTSIKQVKRLMIGVAGFTVLLIGVAMIVLPGPAVVVIPVGLGILATEFVWARSLLKTIKAKFQKKQEEEINHANKTKRT